MDTSTFLTLERLSPPARGAVEVCGATISFKYPAVPLEDITSSSEQPAINTKQSIAVHNPYIFLNRFIILFKL